MQRSIRLRLLVAVLALLVPLSLAAGWLLVQMFGNRLLHDIDVAIEEEAETTAELLTGAQGAQTITDALARISAETDLGGRKFVTLSRNGAVVAESPPGADAALQRRPALRVVRYEARERGDPITVSIGVSTTAAEHARRRLTSLLAVGIPLLLISLGAGFWLVLGRTLRPLAEAADRLDTVAADTLSVRVPVANPHDEVGRVVSVVNAMLDRLERGMGELRRFTADAAHELRTPLTVLRTGLEVALGRDRTADEYRAALTEALAGTDRMCRVAEDLLTLARVESDAMRRAGDNVDVSEMLHELSDAWTEAAAQRQVVFELAVPADLVVVGAAVDLYRLFNNLIENAVRYCAPGGNVQLTAQRTSEGIVATVADRGPGIPADELPRVFDRFYQGRGHAEGSGLGLSIAREIARAHGGQISIANRDGGGCVVSVTLQPADVL